MPAINEIVIGYIAAAREHFEDFVVTAPDGFDEKAFPADEEYVSLVVRYNGATATPPGAPGHAARATGRPVLDMQMEVTLFARPDNPNAINWLTGLVSAVITWTHGVNHGLACFPFQFLRNELLLNGEDASEEILLEHRIIFGTTITLSGPPADDELRPPTFYGPQPSYPLNRITLNAKTLYERSNDDST